MPPPRPSDLGTTSWSKALDLYLASYDASGHAEFSGGVSARVAPAAPLSGALPVSEPRVFRAPLALVDDNSGDREIRRRLNERLTRGTRVSERRDRRAHSGAHPRARALGWSRDSATRLDDARLGVSETRADARTADARGDAGDRGDRGESPKRRGEYRRSDAVFFASRRDAAARGARHPPPPPRRSRSASSGRWSAGSRRASASSPSASSASSSSIDSSLDSSREEEEEEEEVFAASTREKAKARVDAPEKKNPPVSPEARAAARVDALLAGLGVVVFSPDADRRHARAAAEPPRRIAPAPGSAPRAASSARGRRAHARDSEIGDSITTGCNTRAARGAGRGASSGTSGTSPSSSDSDVGGSDAESSSGSGSGAGSTRSRSSAREAPKHKKPERVGAGDDRNARSAADALGFFGSRERAASGTGGGTELGAPSGSNPGGAFPRAASRGSAAEQAALETSAVRRAAEDLEDVSSATSGSISDSGSEGFPAADDARRARGDFLAEQVRLSLAALEQIRETHSLPASPPESPGAAERAAARAARRARRASGEFDADAGAAAATLFLDALEPAAPAAPASPSGLTGAARVRVMYPELFA